MIPPVPLLVRLVMSTALLIIADTAAAFAVWVTPELDRSGNAR